MSESMTNFERVREFHLTFGHPARVTPITQIDASEVVLFFNNIREEIQELYKALFESDADEIDAVIEVADALGDILYTAYGAGLFLGLNMDKVFKEIHRSNMIK